MMAAIQEKARQLYREIAQIPVATGGRIFRSGDELYEIEIKWSQKDLERGNKVSFAKSYLVRRVPAGLKKLSLLSSNSFQHDATSVLLESYSTCGKFRAVLMKGKLSKMESGAEPQQFIEIWDSNSLIKCFIVKEQFGKKHGKINDNDQFSSFQLSSDGSKLLYVAEKKVPDSIPYFKKNNGDEDKGSEPKEMGTEYVYRQSWGELLTTVINPIIVVLDIKTEECTVIDSPSNYSCGRARWVPDSTKELVYVGYNNEPLKLGLLYFLNRKSTLFCANVDTNVSSKIIIINDMTHLHCHMTSIILIIM
ncbi:PREDICTED: acylamino-acid-releasing enzyme-like isoform X2 [Amphimedon queenslandica]|uniref:Acylamino-acid-releasing enzyme N-terminal domain-containing protein n=1 Tax=Amphimedon queenslandica TaxID=400682 RepID=A0AAN0J9H6_AMPQE|nr:PREDICTED: acylamino-acid-releasing enzyme-like isoform X2 [Amphimedon queenslandica]|eukprot:XP_019853674.1 PREDICTED: acylamino-acid-releasing enzyme-like isoform X2 [Amphimedon queenslandica]